MLRRGRPVVDHFDHSEPLYWRCTKVQVDAIPGSGLGVRFPDFSVNRGGPDFGPPEDVLLPNWLDHGVVQFLVRDVPERIDSGPDATYEFKVYHVPDEENYAHSEVRTLNNGTYSPNLAVKSSVVKKEFRQRLGERARVIVAPKQ